LVYGELGLPKLKGQTYNPAAERFLMRDPLLTIDSSENLYSSKAVPTVTPTENTAGQPHKTLSIYSVASCSPPPRTLLKAL